MITVLVKDVTNNEQEQNVVATINLYFGFSECILSYKRNLTDHTATVNPTDCIFKAPVQGPTRFKLCASSFYCWSLFFPNSFTRDASSFLNLQHMSRLIFQECQINTNWSVPPFQHWSIDSRSIFARRSLQFCRISYWRGDLLISSVSRLYKAPFQ